MTSNEDAPVLGSAIQLAAASSTEALLDVLGRAEADAKTSNAVFLDFLFFYCHMTDRIVFARLGAQRRTPFMNALGFSVLADFARGVYATPQIQESEFRILRERLNGFNAEFGSYQVADDATKGLGGTLLWEFGKRVSHTLTSAADLDVITAASQTAATGFSIIRQSPQMQALGTSAPSSPVPSPVPPQPWANPVGSSSPEGAPPNKATPFQLMPLVLRGLAVLFFLGATATWNRAADAPAGTLNVVMDVLMPGSWVVAGYGLIQLREWGRQLALLITGTTILIDVVVLLFSHTLTDGWTIDVIAGITIFLALVRQSARMATRKPTADPNHEPGVEGWLAGAGALTVFGAVWWALVGPLSLGLWSWYWSLGGTAKLLLFIFVGGYAVGFFWFTLVVPFLVAQYFYSLARGTA